MYDEKQWVLVYCTVKYYEIEKVRIKRSKKKNTLKKRKGEDLKYKNQHLYTYTNTATIIIIKDPKKGLLLKRYKRKRLLIIIINYRND